MDGQWDLTLRSEFGHVRLSADRSANGPRLRVQAVRTGASILLDPLELESLTEWRHEDLTMIVRTRAYSPDADESPAWAEP